MHHWLNHRIPGTARFGRRTLILLHCGFVWILMGWLIISHPQRRFSQAGGPLEFLDRPWWGYAWLIGGVLAVVNAPLRKKWNGRDVPGFLGIISPPIIWVVFYLISVVGLLVTGGESGNPRAGTGLAIFYLISVFVLVVAGWPDPDDPAIEVQRQSLEDLADEAARVVEDRRDE
jgi:hypothetical protein